jgi:hypothetical protein
MKELITTQLIEEYQKEVKILRTFALTDEVFVRIRETELFISKLKSKQSEERQNIVDAARHDDLKLSGEDYFNQTFKQEQKVIDANGKEKGK